MTEPGTPEWFEAASSWFDRLLPLPPAARDRELDVLEDAALRAEVVSLLAAHEAASGEFLAWTSTAELSPGSGIGRWTVLSELGRGGMGAVFLVERSEGDFKQRGAAKVLPNHLMQPGLVERFRVERRTISNLEHPYIARLLDGGETVDGGPYFVMEYVDGRTIDSYCKSERPSARAIVELVIQIASAVHFAHQNLVIHRDLKPANILVMQRSDGSVTPKLLDFGIARIIQPETPPDARRASAAVAPNPERTTTRWRTPAYASPEQVRNQRVTTASDTYSLAVVLVELLTGQLPYRLSGRNVYDLERAVCEGEPLPLSRRPDDRSLSTAAWTDLEAVLHHALRKAPDRRYPTTEQFAEDLRRVLGGFPVSAQRLTFGYRLGRFARRSPRQVALSAALAAALTAGVGGIWWQSELVAEESRQVQQINQFLQQILEWPDPDVAGYQPLFIDAVERVARAIDEQFEGQPAVAAGLHARVGRTLHRLGQPMRARPHLERAIAILDANAVNEPDTRAACWLALGEQLLDQRAFPQAHDAFGKARADLSHRRKDSLPLAEVDNLQALLLLEWAPESVASSDLERLQKAVGLLERATVVYDRSPRAQPRDRVRIWNNLGLARSLAGAGQAAESALLRALEIADNRLSSDHPARALALTNYARLVRLDIITIEQSEAAASEALAIRERQHGPNHAEVATTLAELGSIQVRDRRLDDAAQTLQRCLAICSRPEHSERRDLQATLISANRELGKAQVLAGKLTAAIRSLRIATESSAAIYGKDHEWTASARVALADALSLTGQHEAALVEHELARKTLRTIHERVYDRAKAEWYRGNALARAGLLEQAAKAFDRSLAGYREIQRDEKYWNIPFAILGSVRVAWEQGEGARANASAQRALALLEANYPRHTATHRTAIYQVACAGGPVDREKLLGCSSRLIEAMRYREPDSAAAIRVAIGLLMQAGASQDAKGLAAKLQAVSPPE